MSKVDHEKKSAGLEKLEVEIKNNMQASLKFEK